KASGERREDTEWHRIVFYNKLAEIAGEYLRKGRSVYVEGRLRTRKWQSQDGKDNYTTEVIADQMQMLGGRDYSYAPSSNQQQASQRPPQRQPVQERYQDTSSGGMGDMDDDIPF